MLVKATGTEHLDLNTGGQGQQGHALTSQESRAYIEITTGCTGILHFTSGTAGIMSKFISIYFEAHDSRAEMPNKTCAPFLTCDGLAKEVTTLFMRTNTSRACHYGSQSWWHSTRAPC